MVGAAERGGIFEGSSRKDEGSSQCSLWTAVAMQKVLHSEGGLSERKNIKVYGVPPKEACRQEGFDGGNVNWP